MLAVSLVSMTVDVRAIAMKDLIDWCIREQSNEDRQSGPNPFYKMPCESVFI